MRVMMICKCKYANTVIPLRLCTHMLICVVCIRMIVIVIFLMRGGLYILMFVMPLRFLCFISKEAIRNSLLGLLGLLGVLCRLVSIIIFTLICKMITTPLEYVTQIHISQNKSHHHYDFEPLQWNPIGQKLDSNSILSTCCLMQVPLPPHVVRVCAVPHRMVQGPQAPLQLARELSAIPCSIIRLPFLIFLDLHSIQACIWSEIQKVVPVSVVMVICGTLAVLCLFTWVPTSLIRRDW